MECEELKKSLNWYKILNEACSFQAPCTNNNESKALWYKSVFDIYELLCNILDEGFLTADWKQLMMLKYKFSFHVAFSNECLVTVITKRRPRF